MNVKKGKCLMRMALFLALTGSLFLFSGNGFSKGKTGQSKYWVFFRDKGHGGLLKGQQVEALARAHLSERAVQRRLKRGSGTSLFDFTDVPVYPDYIQQIRAAGFRVWTVSKWLNAVSVFASPSSLERLRSFPFVKTIKPVNVFIRPPVRQKPIEKIKAPVFEKAVRSHSLHYGPSFEQDSVIHVPEVHDLGYNGSGVLIGMLDTGFNWRHHKAFQNLKVVAEYDFIHHDSITANEAKDSLYFPDKPGQDAHGTETLSCIGGFAPGELIGPAYGASFALAKTEYVPTETRIEEDNWVAGIEWEDSLGADVVSSSLGYLDFDNGFSYDPKTQLDGNTAVTTIAADLAAKKGIVVVNSAGNEGHSRPTTLITPADGDSVIAVGAVRMDGEIASFSSDGPTSDGRIKPDVVAPGVGVYVVSPYTTDGFTRSSGTSFSCPLTAGVSALILSAYPELKPMQVRDALRNTANNAKYPNNLYGWGLIDAYKALQYAKTEVEGVNGSVIPKKLELSDAYPNPSPGFVSVRYGLPQETDVTISVYNILGQRVKTLFHGDQFAGGNHIVSWNGRSETGEPAPSGVYFLVLKTNRAHATQRILLLRK
ncbi:MAG: S8 family serine peptidase [Calditrichaeota bacterium]|nr:S8 family serine peptidase [Calditrichota bacterium]